MEKYADRTEAGKILAEHLKQYKNNPNAIVLALPRGGVPVGYEIAQSLNIPLDVFIVRKLGVPWHEELAFGAIAMGGACIFNHDIIKELHLTQQNINDVLTAEQQELKRRQLKYRGDKPFPDLKNKIIILVDDGIATGATIKAAIAGLQKHHPQKIIIAVPVADITLCESLKALVHEIICPLRPAHFYAVGAWYDVFDQTSDEEVFTLLK